MHAGSRITFPGFLWRNDTSFNIGRINGRSLASAAVFLAVPVRPRPDGRPATCTKLAICTDRRTCKFMGGGGRSCLQPNFNYEKIHTGGAKFNFERDNCMKNFLVFVCPGGFRFFNCFMPLLAIR